MANPFLQIADDVTYAIKSLDLDIRPSSRIDQMIRVIKHRDNLLPNDPDYETVLEALRDMTQLGFVFDQISSQSQRDECKSVIERLLKDSVISKGSQVLSPGRDAQAELFVYAVCHAGILQPKLTEPDIRCRVSGKEFGIAVKRIKSENELTKRLRKGSKQILRSGVPGIVDIDITLAMNPENYRLIADMPNSQLRDWSEGRLRQLVNDNRRELQKAMEHKPVRGMTLHDHLVVWLQTERRWVLRSMTFVAKNQGNDGTEQAELELFTASFLKGLPNLDF